MIILGLDTALRHTGYGVVRVEGESYEALDCGVVSTPQSMPHSECLRRLAAGLRELIAAHSLDAAALEGAFFSKNVKTAMILGYVRGCVMTVMAEAGIPVYCYSPREVKLSAAGWGGASKEQVALMVSTVLNIDSAGVPDDATDALGLAICHSRRLAASDLHGGPPSAL